MFLFCYFSAFVHTFCFLTFPTFVSHLTVCDPCKHLLVAREKVCETDVSSAYNFTMGRVIQTQKHTHTETHYCLCYTLFLPSSTYTGTYTHVHATAHTVSQQSNRRRKAPTLSIGLLHHRILITSGALVSSEQNQTATLKHTHMHAHTTNIPPPVSLTVADTSKGRVRGGKSGRVWGIMGDKGSD